MKKLLLGFLVIFILVSCGGGSASRIIDASSEQIFGITDSLKEGNSVSDFKTIKSKDFDNVYFLSAIITDAAGNKKTGLWATGGRGSISIFMTVNVPARLVTPFPFGPSTTARIKEQDDGAGILLRSYK